MVIYGVALLSGCLIAGLFCGQLLGRLIGVQANVGGVGIAMLLLILVSDRLRKAGRLKPVSQRVASMPISRTRTPFSARSFVMTWSS